MRNVFAILDELSAGLQELKEALRPLSALSPGARSERSSRQPRRGPQPGRRTPSKKRTRKVASPKIRALRTQQGKYLAALRNLTLQQRAQVKKAKANGDYASALKLAASLRKKSA